MSIVTVGIDLAKNIFALHGVDQSGRAVLVKPKVARGQLLEMIASLPPRIIAIIGTIIGDRPRFLNPC
jgi:transposase